MILTVFHVRFQETKFPISKVVERDRESVLHIGRYKGRVWVNSGLFCITSQELGIVSDVHGMS